MASESEANFRICSSVSEALSYMPCPLQYTMPSNHNELWVFWGQPNNEFPTVFPSTSGTTMYADTVKEKITCALKKAYISDYYNCWLVQFWAPVTSNDRIFLTTCDLPFGLTKLHEGLCLYRSECLKLRIPVGTDNSIGEYQLGPVGRVFKHGFPETSPDVSLYSADDYPQHGLALNAGQGNYLAIPVFEPVSNQCTGVLEIIGDKKGSFYREVVQMVYEMLKKVDLRSSNMYDCPDEKGLKGVGCALKELEEQLNFICRTHQLPLAQTWLPIVGGNNIEGFITTKEQFCICSSASYEFRAACDMFHLGKSQGVIGRAFLSRNSCYCSDITQLRMSEYPLAHVAHRVGLHGSFAVCLQSSYTGDYVYILEFFLPHDNKSDCRCPQTLLNMLLVTMKRQFRSFKLASEKKLGEQLSVEVLSVPSDDGLKTFEICENSKHSSDVEPIASPKEIPWLDTLNRSLNGGNTASTCPENIDATTSTATTANTITEVRNVSIRDNRVVCTCSEEESMRNKSEGQYRVDSVVLQHAVGSKDNSSVITIARLGIQSLPNNCGREHEELNDMNCSSDQLDSANAADGLRKETSGIDQSGHDTTESLARATTPRIQVNSESATLIKRSKFLTSELVTGDSENSAKVPKLCDFTSTGKFWQREAAALRQQLRTMHESQWRHMLAEDLSDFNFENVESSINRLEKVLRNIKAREDQIIKDHIKEVELKINRYENMTHQQNVEKILISKENHDLCTFWKNEAAALRQHLATMHESQRHTLGEDFSGLGMEDLECLKNQLEKSLKSISAKKGKILMNQIEELRQKGNLIHQENVELHEKIIAISNENCELRMVQRENISERMKFLQDLVPGCTKVTGIALVIDEIIDYVQSLQRQVEFLSLKLASFNPRSTLQDICQPNGSVLPSCQHTPELPPLHTDISNGAFGQCSVDTLYDLMASLDEA